MISHVGFGLQESGFSWVECLGLLALDFRRRSTSRAVLKPQALHPHALRLAHTHTDTHTHTHTHAHTHTHQILRPRRLPGLSANGSSDGHIPDLDSLLVTDSEGEEEPAPAAEPPQVDTLHEAVATVCVVLGTSLPELRALHPDRVESLYRRQARVQHPDRNRDNAKRAHQKTIQLGVHRDTLFQFIESWKNIRRLLAKHTPTCVCGRCHDLWHRMTRCGFCLGTNKKHGHQGCGLGKDASYYQRSQILEFTQWVERKP